MKGRKPVPTRLKILTGNPGKRKKDIERNEPTPAPGIPEMPDWLLAFPIAVSEWRRESVILDNMGIMSAAEAGTLAVRCYLAAQIQELAATINESDEKSYSQIKPLITEYRQVGSLLGLDPSSRAKMTVDPLTKPKSKFDGLLQVK